MSKSQVTILLIEDDRTTRRIVDASIRDKYQLYTAENVTDGASLYEELKPDIVLMDANLPDGNGYELLNQITQKNPDAHVVMFTAHGNTDDIFKSMELGAKGFMLKPFDQDKMRVFANKWKKENITRELSYA